MKATEQGEVLKGYFSFYMPSEDENNGKKAHTKAKFIPSVMYST